MAIMGYPELPLRITGIYCRKQTDGMPGNFHGMLIAEDMDGLKSGSLDGVDKTIANHINLDGVPLRMERMLRIVILTLHRGTPSSLYSTLSYWGGSV
jgi:hypothetical protein